MENRTASLAARGLLAAIGAALAVALLIAERPAAEHREFPAQVNLSVAETGELGVDPAAPAALLEASLLPGEREAADFRVRNQTGVPLAVSLRASQPAGELDGLL